MKCCHYIDMLLLQDSWTALHLACRWGHTKVAEILLMNNADILATNKVSDKRYKICIIVSALLESEIQLANYSIINYSLGTYNIYMHLIKT